MPGVVRWLGLLCGLGDLCGEWFFTAEEAGGGERLRHETWAGGLAFGLGGGHGFLWWVEEVDDLGWGADADFG